MKNQMTLKKYLVGNTKETENLYGTILGFRKMIDYNKTFKTFNHFSFLLFYDHRTGRIERYLINSSKIDETRLNKENIEGYNEKIVYNGKEYNAYYEDEHIINEVSSFNRLLDGKLNRKFYTLFMFELFRDYLQYETSYFNGNMANLRAWTLPLEFRENINKETNEIEKFPLGTGNIELLIKPLAARNQEVEYFDAKRYRETNNQIIRVINVPKVFANKYLSDMLLEYKLKLNPVITKECPQCIIDLRRSINIRDINNSADLRRKIKIFNYNISKKLEKLEKLENI